MKHILSAIEKFKNFKIGVIGDLILDEYIWGTADRISPEAPVPVVLQQKREIRPGGAANVAFNLVELGANVSLFGVVGNDPYADELKMFLQNRGINTTGIVPDRSRPTTVKTRIIAHRQQIVRLDREITEPLNEHVADALLDELKNASAELDALIFEDYDKGVLSADIIIRGIELLEGKFRAVDPKHRNFWNYGGVDLFKPNIKELSRAMAGEDVHSKNIIPSIKKAHDRLKVRHLLVTAGENGMYLSGNDTISHIPAHKRDVYDVTGAGDTVIAVVVLGILSGLKIEEAALLASIAAGIEVSKLGTATVSVDELVEAVEENWEILRDKIEVIQELQGNHHE